MRDYTSEMMDSTGPILSKMSMIVFVENLQDYLYFLDGKQTCNQK